LAAVKEKVNSPPASIVIPTLDLNLPIAPGIVKNNQWTLYDDKISWLATSEPPGSGKNVILYGHNRPLLFGKLTNLQIGEEITVTDNNGMIFTYTVAQRRKVLPEDIDVIISPKNQLTLYTCDGSFDEKRLIVIAYPKT
jgi:LPXTG-site transpeptidase (sortase) family protein